MSQPNQEPKQEPIKTKGMYLTELYNEFKEVIKNDKELKAFYSLFELLDCIEDVIYMTSFVFPVKGDGDVTESMLKTVLEGYDIKISDAKFKEFFPTFQEFLTKFRSV